MKICFAVCEYNPFHNGHLYHIEYIKRELKPDYIAIIMSGNFTQRGEIAIIDKYERAKHAVKAGADVVIELPTVFATANAELFARGAIKLIDCCGGEKCLCFGTESANKESLLTAATALSYESKEFKRALKQELKSGVSTIKAKYNALKQTTNENFDFELLQSPNNILGIEYAKAILKNKSNIDVCPILRKGAAYNDSTLYKDFSSASAIRTAIRENQLKKIKRNVPKYVFNDIPNNLPNADDLIFYAAIKSPKEEMSKVLDCTEGLENRIKALTRDCNTLECLIDKIKTKRYTKTRISRILLANMLGINESFIRKCLSSELYLKVLAVNKDKTDVLSAIKGENYVPLLTRKSDYSQLSGVARECFLTDVKAMEIFDFVNKSKTSEYDTKFV